MDTIFSQIFHKSQRAMNWLEFIFVGNDFMCMTDNSFILK